MKTAFSIGVIIDDEAIDDLIEQLQKMKGNLKKPFLYQFSEHTYDNIKSSVDALIKK